VLVSDGIVNRGNNPLYEAENLFVPIYTIGVGDTTPQVDLAISQIRAPEIIFRGDKIDILITVAAQNAQGKKMQFSLQQGTNIVSTKEITIADNQMATVFSATIEAKNAGILNFTAQVAALPEERNKINNKRQFSVEVIENRKKIAVVAAAPHPDVSALREALKKVEAYEVLWLDGTKSIPADVALVVVFVQPGTQAQKLESQLKGYAGSLWLFVDPMSRPNALNPFFPTVRMGESGGMATSKPILNDNFGQFGLSADAKTWLKNLPDVTISASGVNANGTFENLFAANKGTPLAQYGNADKRKMVIFSFSGLWQLRIENFKQQNNHRFIDEWLQVTAQYLTQDSRSNRLKITYSKRQPAGLPFAVAAEVYDAAFQPFAGAEVSIRLQPQKGDFLDFAIPYADGNYKTDITALEAGTYSFTATAKMGNETLKSSGNFLIEEMTLEDLDTRANFEVLKQMADASGGAFLTTKNIGDGLTQNIQTSRIEQIDMRSIPLIELKWLFFLGLLFLSIEWTLRRYFGDI
jgi:hypothetical protein